MENHKMHHSKKILVAAALATSMSTAHAIETTITFDDEVAVNNLHIPVSTYAIGDVTFDGIGRTVPTGRFSFKSSTNNPDYSGVYLQGGGDEFTSFKFSFDNAVNSVSMNIGNNRNDWELSAYSSTGSQIGNSIMASGLAFLTNNGGNPFSLNSTDYDISYVTLINQGGLFYGTEDLIRVDNFTYNTEASVTPVPEPSTYALMLGGLGMVGFMAYRRRKAENA